MSSNNTGSTGRGAPSGSWATPGFLTRKFRKNPKEFDKFDVTFSTSEEIPYTQMNVIKEKLFTVFWSKLELSSREKL